MPIATAERAHDAKSEEPSAKEVADTSDDVERVGCDGAHDLEYTSINSADHRAAAVRHSAEEGDNVHSVNGLCLTIWFAYVRFFRYVA